MTRYTASPWRVCGGVSPSYIAITSEAGYIVFGMADPLVDEEGGYPIRTPSGDEQRANARRIVAAVNACAGIPTEALEGGIIERLKGAAQTAHVLAIQYNAAASEKAMAELLDELGPE